ncbi:MAG: protein kinase [Gammaproteobacteria bacterium]
MKTELVKNRDGSDGIKMNLSEFPEAPADRVKFAMAAASRLIANTTKKISKDNPIVLSGQMEEQLMYLWTAIVVFAYQSSCKFDVKHIIIRSTAWNCGKELNMFGYFTKKSCYETKFKQYLQPYMLEISKDTPYFANQEIRGLATKDYLNPHNPKMAISQGQKLWVIDYFDSNHLRCHNGKVAEIIPKEVFKSTQEFIEEANQKYQNNDGMGALAMLENAMSLDDENNRPILEAKIAICLRGQQDNKIPEIELSNLLKKILDIPLPKWNQSIMNFLCEIKIALKKYDEIINYTKDCIDKKYCVPDAYYFRAKALSGLKKYEEAKKDFNQAVSLGCQQSKLKAEMDSIEKILADQLTQRLQRSAALVDQAAQKYTDKQYSEAVELYKSAIELNVSNQNAQFGCGMSLLSLDKYQESLAYFNQAIRLKNNCVPSYLNRGLAYAGLSNFKNALDDLNKAIELEPNNQLSYGKRAQVYIKSKNYKGAIYDLNKAIKLVPSDYNLYLEIGRVFVLQENYQEAIINYQKFLEFEQANSDAWNRCGLAQLKLGKYEEAINSFTKIVDLNLGNQLSNIYNNRAVAYYTIGKYDKALMDLEHSLRLDGTNKTTVTSYAVTYWAAGRYEEALQKTEEALKLWGTFSAVPGLIPLRAMLKKLVGDPEGAQSDYLQAQKLEYVIEPSYYLLGKAHESFGDLQSAVDSYRRSLQVCPHYLPAKNALALVENKSTSSHNSSLLDNDTDLLFEQKLPPEKLNHNQQNSLSSTGSLANATTGVGVVTLNLSIEYTDLKFDKRLGQGAYGEVYSGTWRYNQVAIKKLLGTNYNEDAIRELQQEAQVLAKVRSDYVVQIKGLAVQSPHYCLVMELMPKGNLYDLLQSEQPLGWTQRYQLAQDIGIGLHHLHAENILHRDLKSLNVLLTNDYRAKLCDFGLAKIKTTTKTQSRMTQTNAGAEKSVGTLPWMAPELFGLRPKYSTKSDIYAYGIIMWELSARRVPYEDAASPDEIRSAVREGEREEIPTETPVKFAALIGKCWAQRAEARPEVDEVLQELETCKQQLR